MLGMRLALKFSAQRTTLTRIFAGLIFGWWRICSIAPGSHCDPDACRFPTPDDRCRPGIRERGRGFRRPLVDALAWRGARRCDCQTGPRSVQRPECANSGQPGRPGADRGVLRLPPPILPPDASGDQPLAGRGPRHPLRRNELADSEPVSSTAARVALAANWQGRSAGVHEALFTVPGKLDEAKIREATAGRGVDMERLDRDMTQRSGALSYDDLRSLVAKARGRSPQPA